MTNTNVEKNKNKKTPKNESYTEVNKITKKMKLASGNKRVFTKKLYLHMGRT